MGHVRGVLQCIAPLGSGSGRCHSPPPPAPLPAPRHARSCFSRLAPRDRTALLEALTSNLLSLAASAEALLEEWSEAAPDAVAAHKAALRAQTFLLHCVSAQASDEAERGTGASGGAAAAPKGRGSGAAGALVGVPVLDWWAACAGWTRVLRRARPFLLTFRDPLLASPSILPAAACDAARLHDLPSEPLQAAAARVLLLRREMTTRGHPATAGTGSGAARPRCGRWRRCCWSTWRRCLAACREWSGWRGWRLTW